MFEREITGLFVSTEGTVKIAKEKDELKNWYDLLNCSCIDIPERLIGDRPYMIICDDEGLLKEKPIPTIFGNDGTLDRIFGNVFICGLAKDGELRSLTSDEIAALLKHLILFWNEDTGEGRIVVADMGYVR